MKAEGRSYKGGRFGDENVLEKKGGTRSSRTNKEKTGWSKENNQGV